VALRQQPVSLGDWACPRKPRTGSEQVAAHLVLGQLEELADPRSACTMGLTATDLYLPKGSHSHVTGASDSERRVGIFSIARYAQGGVSVESVEALSKSIVKVLSRECFKLCGMRECRLLRCLMNPCSGGPLEAINALPLGLCCICLRKLHWLSQVDLLDWYANLAPILAQWFPDEAEWLQQRMVQVGMPSYVSLSSPKFPEPNLDKFSLLGS